MKLHKFNLEIPFNAHGVPVVNIMEMTKEQVKAQWNLIPDEMKIDTKTKSHSVCETQVCETKTTRKTDSQITNDSGPQKRDETVFSLSAKGLPRQRS